MNNYNKYNAVCPDENELLAFKQGTLSNEDKNFLTEHLLTCDFCLMNLQFMPWESIEHKNTLLADDKPKKERTSVPESLKKAFDLHRKIRASKPKVEPVNFDNFFKIGKLKVGQIWRTKFDGIVFPSLDGENFYSIPKLGSVPHLIVVTNILDLPEIDNLGKKYQVIKVITIDNNIQYATEGDIVISEKESPLGYAFMLQAWNQRKMLRQNLDAYLGEINFTPQSFKSSVKSSFQELSDYLTDLGRKEVSGAAYSFIGLIKKGIYSDPVMRYRAREFENTVYLSDPVDNLLEPLIQEIPSFVPTTQPKAVELGFFQKLNFIPRIYEANTAYASSKTVEESAEPKLIIDGPVSEEYNDLFYKVFLANNEYEILIQSSASKYNGKIVLLGIDEETISLLAVISDKHEVHDGFVSNLYYKEDISKSIINPLGLMDEQSLSFYFESGKISEAVIKGSIESSGTASGLNAWRKIAESESTGETLKNTILNLLEQLK